MIFVINDAATTEIYTRPLHDALPIWAVVAHRVVREGRARPEPDARVEIPGGRERGHRSGLEAHPSQPLLTGHPQQVLEQDRKSTRLNSSHANISYAVFCLTRYSILHH